MAMHFFSCRVHRFSITAPNINYIKRSLSELSWLLLHKMAELITYTRYWYCKSSSHLMFSILNWFTGFWNSVFLLSNLAMFVMLPFAYLFTESEGFFGHRKGLWARTYETFVVLILFATVVLGLTYVLAQLFNEEERPKMIPIFSEYFFYLHQIFFYVWHHPNLLWFSL